MYRLSEAYPGRNILRIGTVDDFNLHETKLKPKRETYVVTANPAYTDPTVLRQIR
jgi:hypothetical protein